VSPISPRTTAALLIIAALIAGGVLGVAGDRFYLQWRPRHNPRMSHMIVDHLSRELDLTAQQKTAVQQIVDRHRARIDAITATTRPQIRQEIDATNNEIEKVLQPAQLAKFRQMRARFGQHHRGRGFGTPGGGPPPER
jgi:hypothetical protein